jgi:hypothetical protein
MHIHLPQSLVELLHAEETFMKRKRREPIENMEGGEKLLLREKGSLALVDSIV